MKPFISMMKIEIIILTCTMAGIRIPQWAFNVEQAESYKTTQRHDREDILLSLIYSSMSSAFKHKTNSSNKRGRSHSRPCVISGWTCRLKYLQRQENKMRKTSTQCMSAYSLKCTASQAAGRIQGYIHNAHSILPHEYLKKYSFQTWMTLFLLQNKQEDIEFDFLCPQNKGQWGPKPVLDTIDFHSIDKTPF